MAFSNNFSFILIFINQAVETIYPKPAGNFIVTVAAELFAITVSSLEGKGILSSTS